MARRSEWAPLTSYGPDWAENYNQDVEQRKARYLSRGNTRKPKGQTSLTLAQPTGGDPQASNNGTLAIVEQPVSSQPTTGYQTVDPPRLLTVPEAAEILRLKESKVYQMIAEGRLPGAGKIDGSVRILAEQFYPWIRSHFKSTGSKAA